MAAARHPSPASFDLRDLFPSPTGDRQASVKELLVLWCIRKIPFSPYNTKGHDDFW